MNLAPLAIQKFFDNNGRPLVGGKLFTYVAGTSIKTATYIDSSGGTPNTNPIILNFRGECRLWLDPLLAYKFILAPAFDSDPPTFPIWTVDNITVAPQPIDNAAVDTGTVNNIVLTIPQLSSPLVAFTRIIFRAANTNTGPVLITINGGTSKSLTWQNLAALAGGEIQANGIYEAIYDGAQWQLQGPALQPTQIRTPEEIAAGATPVNYSILNHRGVGYVDPLRYGMNTSPGVTNMTAAINMAISVAKQLPNGGTIQLPLGDLLVTSTLALNDNRLHMRGCGAWATRIIFTPTANDTCIELGATGLGDRTSQGTLSDLCLYSDEATFTKIGIDCIDISGWDIRNIVIQGGVVVPGVATFWSGGAGSIGIRTRGRELCSLHALYIYADRPIVLADNPSNSIDIDHFHFYDLTLAANGNAIVEGSTGLNLSDLTFDGYQSWNLGDDGFRWVDTTSSLVSLRLKLANIRWEQGSSASDYLVRIEHNTTLQGLIIENCYGGLDRSGFYLRNVQNVALLDSYYIGGVGFVALDVTGTVNGMRFDGMFWQAGSTASLVGQRLIYANPFFPNSAALPRDAYYDQSANGDVNLRIGVPFSQPTITIANNGTFDVGGTATCCILDIVSSEGFTAQFALTGAVHTTSLLTSFPVGFYSNTVGTAANTNVYWNAGTNTYRIQNLRGASVNYRINMAGSFASF